MASYDYKSVDGDLVFEDGDLVPHDAQQDHIESIMLMAKGELRQFPLVGVGLFKYVNAPWNLKQIRSLEKAIRLQLVGDGYQIHAIQANDPTNILVDAEK